MTDWLSDNGLFYLLTGVTALFALMCVHTRFILRSAVYLMAVLFFVAGMYLQLGMEFLAGIQVLVYVGGIVVLLVFAVMLTQSDSLAEDKTSVSRKLLALGASVFFFLISCWAISQTPMFTGNQELAPLTVDIKNIGRALLDTGATGYVLPFEIVSLLLLAVLIGGVVIARKKDEG